MSKAKLEKKLCLAKDSPEPVFDLSECDLKRIPNVFAVIKVLRKECLYLQNNKLFSLKEGGNLCDLSFLKLLDLSSNKFSKLPPDIKHLKNLQILRLDHNELTSLPDEIGSLSNLEQLTVSSNKLTSLPDSICKLSKLQLLDVRKNKLHSLPTTIYQNRSLQSLMLDEDQEWKNPPKAVVVQGIQAILSYFAREHNVADYQVAVAEEPEIVATVSSNLDQLCLYDKLIQDNLRRLEKEKEEKMLVKMNSERNIFDQKERELMLHQQNRSDKQKMLQDIVAQQKKIDEQVLECQKLKKLEQSKFIEQLQNVEKTADNVITQLIQINNAQKQRSVEKWVLSLIDDVPVKEDLRRQEILESMEKLLADEYFLMKKFEENDVARRNIIEVSNLKETELKSKIKNLLSKRRDEQSGLLDTLRQDSDLQCAAVLMLLEKSDYRNIELQNQIAVIQNQLSNLTALELQNKRLHLSKHINEIAERRMMLSELLADIFGQQQANRQQLIDQLLDAENRQSSKYKNEYWLLQYQRLLNSQCGSLSQAARSVDPALVFELALLGVSHYAPLLSTLNCQSMNDFSQVTNAALIDIGVSSSEDRAAILKAIHHYVSEQRSHQVLPSAPSLQHSEALGSFTSPTAPPLQEIGESTSSNLNEVLVNECVICMEKQSGIVFLPCGHSCTCLHCSALVKICPLCRSCIERKIQIFTA